MIKVRSRIYLDEEVNVKRKSYRKRKSYFPMYIHDYNGDMYQVRLTHSQIRDILKTAIKIQNA